MILPACADRLDNDGDGLVDFPADGGCRSAWWIEAPACEDGIDNDLHDATDYPADSECVAAWNGTESCGLG